MMNSTYNVIISNSEFAWNYQWAKTLFYLEFSLSEKQKLDYLKQYSVNVTIHASEYNISEGEEEMKQIECSNETTTNNKENGDDDEKVVKLSSIKHKTATGATKLVPALMLIKRSKETRAERRSIIVSNWQVSLFSIMHLIYVCFCYKLISNLKQNNKKKQKNKEMYESCA